MHFAIKKTWKLDILLAITVKDIKVRYKHSELGLLWLFLQPMLLFGMFLLVRQFVRIDSNDIPYPLMLYAAIVPWTFINNSISIATASIINNREIIKKIPCPRIFFPAVAIPVAFVDFTLALPFLFALLFYYHVGISWHIIFLPVVFFMQVLMCAGIGFTLSALAAMRRDFFHAIPFAMQAWMFASPIFYPLQAVPEKWLPWYLMNPAAMLIESYRAILLYHHFPPLNQIVYLTLFSTGLFLVGVLVFLRLQRYFADVL